MELINHAGGVLGAPGTPIAPRWELDLELNGFLALVDRWESTPEATKPLSGKQFLHQTSSELGGPLELGASSRGKKASDSSKHHPHARRKTARRPRRARRTRKARLPGQRLSTPSLNIRCSLADLVDKWNQLRQEMVPFFCLSISSYN